MTQMKAIRPRLILLCLVLLVLWLLTSLSPFNKGKIAQFCAMTPDDFCERQDVELVGRFNDPRLEPGQGYLFTPEAKSVGNPLYVSAVRYSGVLLGFGSEQVFHEIPFGSKVKVRGRVNLNDKYRCSDNTYATGHPAVCTASGMRILVVPTAIVGIQGRAGESVKYSIFGTLKDFANVTKNECGTAVILCEDTAREICHQIQLLPSQCAAITHTSNMFLVNGYTADITLKSVVPGQIYQVSGVDYSSQPTDSATSTLLDQSAGLVNGFTVHDKTGQEIVTAIPGAKNNYFDLGKVIPTTKGAYYFDKNTLFFIDRAKNKTGTARLDMDYFDTNFMVYAVQYSAATNKVALMAVKSISQGPIRNSPYQLKKYLFTFLEIYLLNGETRVIYTETLDGFMHLLGYDFTTGTGLVSYSLDEEQPDACRRTYYARIGKGETAKKMIDSFITEGNKYCTQVWYKQLFVSRDGKYLVMGSDFNPNVSASREQKLLIFSLPRTGLSKNEYLAQSALLYSETFVINDVSETKVTLKDSSSYYDNWEFSRDKDEYSYANLTGVILPSPGPNTPSWSYFVNTKLLFEDRDRYYLFARPAAQYQLYAVNKKTRESFLVGTFSPTVKPVISGGDLFILDRPLENGR